MQPTEPALSFNSSAPEGASMVVVNGTSAAVQPASASAPAPMALSQETMEVSPSALQVSPSAPQASQMMHGDVASPCLADVVTPRLMTCNGVGSIGQGTSCQSLGTPTKLPAGTFPQAVSPSMMMTPDPYKTYMHVSFLQPIDLA